MANISGTPGDDNLTGTFNGDTFDLTQGGNDHVDGLDQEDVFNFGATFTGRDHVIGGTWYDHVVLDGDYSAGLKLHAATLHGVEELLLRSGFSYDLTLVNENFSPPGDDMPGFEYVPQGFYSNESDAGDFVRINARAEVDTALTFWSGAADDTFLGGGGNDTFFVSSGNDVFYGGGGHNTIAGNGLTPAMTVDLSTHGAQIIFTGEVITMRDVNSASGSDQDDALIGNRYGNSLRGSAGSDVIRGGPGNDFLDGGMDADRITSGTGNDTFDYVDWEARSSTSSTFDTITDCDFAHDRFLVMNIMSAIDPTVVGGLLSDATFDAQLARMANAAALHVRDAVLVKPDGGDHAGETFLVIDYNKVAGYQAGEDVVIRLTNTHHEGLMSVGNFHGFF